MRSERLLRPAAVAALTLFLAAAFVGSSLAGGKGSQHRPSAGHKPLVVGHRGAAGYRPEHTLASYALAARMGADYIEPDLVSAKDGVLVARHEPEISGTTDVADHPEFADRRTTRNLDGAQVTGWFTDDFTLAELRTLRAKERLPDVRQHNTLYDGRYKVPTFQEVLDLRARLSRELHRRIGIYPETKHPTYFRERGLPLEPALVRTLRRNGLDGPRDKVFVQSFEVGNLKALNRKIDVPLVQLFDEEGVAPYDFVASGDPRTYGDLATDAGLRGIARYADGVGPWKNYIVPRDASDGSGTPTDFVDRAHRAGLLVHPYTFRNENQFLPLELRKGDDPNAYGDAFSEYEQFFELGVDGLFSDNPDTAVAARDGL
jgi:glycerophosphoryl diester phosphodiesterase